MEGERERMPWLLICIPSCRADGVMRTMAPEKLLKSMPILQEQIDALLEFDVCIEADPALTLSSDLKCCTVNNIFHLIGKTLQIFPLFGKKFTFWCLTEVQCGKRWNISICIKCANVDFLVG